MLTSKIVIEIIEKHYDFLDAWIAAINLFQVNLDKPWNYRWYCYEKQWCWRWGCRGCKRTPKSFDLLKIREKWRPMLFDFKKWRPMFAWKHETLFWRLHQKEVFMIFVGENLQAKVAQKLFGQVWGNSGKILHPRPYQIICWKNTLYRSWTSRACALTWRETAQFVWEWFSLFAVRVLAKPYHFDVN